jgi:hypothetical protein
MLAVSALSWTMLNLFLRPNGVRYVVTGVLLALAILTRTIFALWIPIVCALALWIEVRLSGGRGRRSLLMLCVALLVLMPWFVRNCIVLRAFMPLGTQGAINLPVGYSNKAISQDGIWSGGAKEYIFKCFTSQTKGVLRERDEARFGLAKAREWILSNPDLAAKLVCLKIISLWQPRSMYQVFLLMLVIIGLLILWRRKEATVLYGLLVANTFAVGLTWSVGGRFLIPVYPIIYSLAAIVLWSLFGRWILPRKAYTRSKAFGGMVGRIKIPSQERWAVYGKVIAKLGHLLAVAVVLLSFIGLAVLLSFTVAYGPSSTLQAMEETVVTEAEPEHPAEINFDDKLVFLGYNVEKVVQRKKNNASWVKKYLGVYAELLQQRTTFHVTYFWRCLEGMEKDYTLVTQFEGYHGKTYRINQSHQGVNGAYPTSMWHVGQVIREEYQVEVPADYPPIRYTLWVGVQDGEEGLQVTGDVETDEENRLRLGEIEVLPAEEPSPLAAEPQPQNRVEVNINDELLFLGYDLSEGNPQPGDQLKVTTYWLSLRKTEQDYAIQVELRNGEYKVREMLDIAPTRLWQQGRYYQGDAVIAINPHLLEGTYSLNLGLDSDDGTGSQLSLASLDISCQRRHIINRLGKANYGGSEIISPTEPLSLRFHLKDREPLEVVASWTGKARGDETRVELYITNAYWRERYLGTWLVKAGDYRVTERKIGKAFTAPGENVIELRVPELTEKVHNIGWRGMVDRLFPDLLQDPRTDYDGPIQMDFAQVSSRWEEHWDDYYDLAQVYAERWMMAEVARLYEETVDKAVGPKRVEDLALFKDAYAALGKLEQAGEIEKRITGHIAQKMSVNLAGKVEFLGHSLRRDEGNGHGLSLFFRCLQEMEQDYTLWVHGEVEDESLLEGQRREAGYAMFDHLLPTSRWQVGEVYQDDEVRGLRPGRYHFTLGLWRPEKGSRGWREDNREEHVIDLGWVKIE